MMLGIILGGWFFKENMFNLLIFLVFLSILTAILTTKMITETLILNTRLGKNNMNSKNVFKSYKAIIGDYRFILFTLGGIMLMSIEFQRDNYIAVRLTQDFSPISLVSNNISLSIDGFRMLSILTVVNMLFIILFTSVVSKYVNQFREKKMYIGFLLFTIGYAVCSISNNLIILLTATVILSIGELLYVPIRQSILSEIIDENKRGAYMALNSLVIQFGKFVASSCLLVSPYLKKFMMGSIVLIFGLLSILFTLIAIRKKWRDIRHRNLNAM
ncbi:MFS transporter [Cytobacillus firmus]|uniref:MFS transporter n=1 Tax=Cytobacillus firmus TaxID=1399 RepID=UPI0018CE2742|nr:MFS transporter [Cytobacillus firmus]MED1909049.1 MFS transporter [Cytobacillus firmus]